MFECDAYRSNSFGRASAFWLPLLALYTGGRIDELASIKLEHVSTRDEVNGILLSPEGEKSGKNAHSKRFVPLHPRLIDCGFLCYVKLLRGEARTDLFPCLPNAERDGKGKAAGRDFQKFRRELAVGAAKGELRAATRIASSSTRMVGYVSDLLDFTQTLLGAGLTIVRAPVDLTTVCQDVVDELQAAHPTATVKLEAGGNPCGQWDAARLSQMLSNLVANAINHGVPDRPVTVRVSEADGASVVEVQNEGEPIRPEQLPTLFQPLRQSTPVHQRRPGSSGMGLGLFIAREIAVAHGGTIDVASEADTGTTFTVRLPPG